MLLRNRTKKKETMTKITESDGLISFSDDEQEKDDF